MFKYFEAMLCMAPFLYMNRAQSDYLMQLCQSSSVKCSIHIQIICEMMQNTCSLWRVIRILSLYKIHLLFGQEMNIRHQVDVFICVRFVRIRLYVSRRGS